MRGGFQSNNNQASAIANIPLPYSLQETVADESHGVLSKARDR